MADKQLQSEPCFICLCCQNSNIREISCPAVLHYNSLLSVVTMVVDGCLALSMVLQEVFPSYCRQFLAQMGFFGCWDFHLSQFTIKHYFGTLQYILFPNIAHIFSIPVPLSDRQSESTYSTVIDMDIFLIKLASK